MQVEILEKRDNEVYVKFIGQCPLDAMQMALVTLGLVKDESTLSTYSGESWPLPKINFGSFSVPVIENMQRPKEVK